MSNKAVIQTLADMVPYGSRVLDLGCGDGSLLSYLQTNRGCTGYGVEINDDNIAACVKRGVNVIQLNLDQGLSIFADQSFDVVLQIDTLQNLRNAETMLMETLRVGKMGIITFPNFAHWFNRWSVLAGRMPVTRKMPFEWYDTPNIRVGTFADFQALTRKKKLHVKASFGLNEENIVRWIPNLRATTAVFQLTADKHGNKRIR
jgi:methionine biosynthesis protein MetW